MAADETADFWNEHYTAYSTVPTLRIRRWRLPATGRRSHAPRVGPLSLVWRDAAESSWYSNTYTAGRAVWRPSRQLEFWTPEVCPVCNAAAMSLALDREAGAPFQWRCTTCGQSWPAIPQHRADGEGNGDHGAN